MQPLCYPNRHPLQFVICDGHVAFQIQIHPIFGLGKVNVSGRRISVKFVCISNALRAG